MLHTVNWKRRLLAAAIVLIASQARAQDRPFVFSITPAPAPSRPELRVDVDLGAGESAFRSDQTMGPEERIGVQATDGRFTLIGRVGVATATSASYQGWQEGDVLYSFTGAHAPVRLAGGGGIRREIDGTTVLLAHVVAAHDTAATRTSGDFLLEHANAAGRDAADVAVSGGWSRDIGRGVSLGGEALGEDLEGFWNPEEAEGGSRLLVGPSIHLAPTGRKWQVTTVGGPIFHPRPTLLTTDAIRALPPTTARVSYAVAVTFTYSIF